MPIQPHFHTPRTGRPASASVPATYFMFFPTGRKCQPEGEDIGSGCCGGGGIQLRLREGALLRQGQLFEPTASSGPAAMVLATFRNLSCIPRRSPCPERYPLPLALGFPSLSRNQQHLPMESLPGPISSPSGVPLPPNTFSHLTKSLSGSMPAPSGVRPPTKSPTSTPVYPQPHRSFQPPIQPHPFFS